MSPLVAVFPKCPGESTPSQPLRFAQQATQYEDTQQLTDSDIDPGEQRGPPSLCDSQPASPDVIAHCISVMLRYGGGRQMAGFPRESKRMLQPGGPMDAESGRIA